MKTWLLRYLTETSPLTLFVTTSLLVLLVALFIQLVGSSIMGLAHFAQFVESAKPWLLPLRLLVYALTARYWWLSCRRAIERSTSPGRERRARNRISVAGVLYITAIEYGCWISNWEVQLP